MTSDRKHKKLRHFGQFLSASAIARIHGLSPPTIIRRYAHGLRDEELVARAYTLDVQGGISTYCSARLPSPGEARYRLRRAEWCLSMARERLMNARALGEARNVIFRLEKALHRAESRRMYASEIVRMAEDLEEDAA